MANNRLFLYNKKTKAAFYVAKTMGGEWYTHVTMEAMLEWITWEDSATWECMGSTDLVLLAENDVPDDAVVENGGFRKVGVSTEAGIQWTTN